MLFKGHLFDLCEKKMRYSKILQHGYAQSPASRTFLVEASDDAELHLLDPAVLEELADGAGVPWDICSEHHCQATDHEVIACYPSGQKPLETNVLRLNTKIEGE